MRKIIAAMRMSLDGSIEGPQGEVDWVGNWEDSFGLLPRIDTCILGRGMYLGYEQYWLDILANPIGLSALTGKVATKAEVEYAHFADKTPHFVLSKTLDKDEVTWNTTQIVRDVEEISNMKQEPGKDMYAVGGATLISSLMNRGLIDELRLTLHPIVLGGGKALFKDVRGRHALRLEQVEPRTSGEISLTYVTRQDDR